MRYLLFPALCLSVLSFTIGASVHATSTWPADFNVDESTAVEIDWENGCYSDQWWMISATTDQETQTSNCGYCSPFTTHFPFDVTFTATATGETVYMGYYDSDQCTNIFENHDISAYLENTTWEVGGGEELPPEEEPAGPTNTVLLAAIEENANAITFGIAILIMAIGATLGYSVSKTT